MATEVENIKGNFYVRHHNEITGERIRHKGFKTLDEAKKKANEIEIDFYKKHTNLLPKGVTIKNQTFRLSIASYLISSESKGLRDIASARTLKEIKELKLKCLSSIIG
jgi:hypothetical protein